MAEPKAKIVEQRKSFDAQALPHMDALFRTALRMTKNTNDAEDLVQETYVKAYRFWEKFEPGSNARAWLFKIMTNVFINEYRSKSRTPIAVNVDELDDNFLYGQLATTAPADDPEKKLFAKIFDDDVKRAIENLPDDFRLVVVLSFIEGFSYQEIAEIADLQLGTVKSRLHRGRKLLQKELLDYAIKNGFIKDTAK